MSYLRKIRKIIINAINLLVYKTDHFSDMGIIDEEFGEIYKQCKPFTVSSKLSLYSTYKSIEYIIKNRIPGAIVECGVWKGGSALTIILTLIKFGDTDRQIYLYDTYNGMTKPTSMDFSILDKKLALPRWEKNQFKEWEIGTLEEVKKILFYTKYSLNKIVFVKGDVEETISQIYPEKISLLRLDTDWYSSTKHELVNLFPRLVNGGVLIVDDYGYWAGSKKAVDEFFKEKPILLTRIDQTARIAIKT